MEESRFSDTERGISGFEIKSDYITVALVTMSVMILLYYALIPSALATVSQYYIGMFTLGFVIMMAGGGLKVMRAMTSQVKRLNMYMVIIGVAVIIIFQSAVFSFAPAKVTPLQVGIAVLIAGAVAEEWAFRGGLLNIQLMYAPKTYMGKYVSIIVNAMIFALFHTVAMKYIYGGFNYYYVLAIFGSGAILALSAVMSKTLTVPMVIHSVFNITATRVSVYPLMAVGGINQTVGMGMFIGALIFVWKYLEKRVNVAKTNYEKAKVTGAMLALLPFSIYVGAWGVSIYVVFMLTLLSQKIAHLKDKIVSKYHKSEPEVKLKYDRDKALEIAKRWVGCVVDGGERES